NGNQTGALMTEYILRRRKESGTLPVNGAIVKTIVTTELARKIASGYGVATFDVLTGFKYIGEKIKEWETTGEYVYLFGFEESYGSLVGTHARDKDAVAAAMIFAEMICYYDSLGMSLWQVLQNIYARFGFFDERSTSVAFGGVDGMDRMKGIMQKLRDTAFGEICGVRVEAADDLVTGVRRRADGGTEKIALPSSNALKLHLAGGDWICARPSGTEPKLKFYAAASAKDAESAESRAAEYLAFMKRFAE
ncbi:MAG TPA: phospho-sugar mutase, partial [Candidatus Limadaptatus stercoravium]|nr:phospho-sugar mutase [Candidatus Limadaptatus stercoravium]